MGKLTSLEDALSVVEDGTHLALNGFAITRNAVAAALELIRAGRRGLRVTQVIVGIETDLLVGAGCVERLVYSGGSLDRFGLVYALNRAINDGRLAIEEHSTLTLTLRLAAGGLGLPYIPTRSLLGSGVLDQLLALGDVREGTDPFTGAPVLLLAPLRPEVAIVHVDTCDEDGNAAIEGPLWSIRETVQASSHVIVTTEKVVAPGTIAPGRAVIPGAIVSAVVEVPGGARPSAMPGSYDYDRTWMETHVAAARAGGEDFDAYLAGLLEDASVSR